MLILIAGIPLIAGILLLDFIVVGRIPVFIQERLMDLENQKIKILKIRTIVDSNGQPKEVKNNLILRKDELKKYVPWFCKWLRKSGIDEILQVFNVLKGEMSLVGPRPLIPEELDIIKEKYPGLYNRREKITSLPGITGFWQIYGDRNKGVKNLVELDEIYERNKSLLLDFKIILKTFMVMLTATHSDAILGKKEKANKLKISLAE